MAPAPRIGTEFAGYRIEGLLGRGGMGVVYRAEHPRVGASIALKVRDPDLAMDEGFRERFVGEARVAARIRHPNIIPIYDAGEWQGELYIAMRYIEGDDLRSGLRKNGALPPGEAIVIGLQIASALDAAHRSGLVHRDVKPANILVESGPDPDSGPIAYLADLGLTKHVDSHRGATGTGELLGTIDYIAPEQITGSRIDGRADVYSLACVLFECLTGSVPYARENQAAVLCAHLHDDVPRATAVNASLPDGVDSALARGLAKSPEDRFPTGRELVAALRQRSTRRPRAAGTRLRPTRCRVPRPFRRPRSRRPRGDGAEDGDSHSPRQSAPYSAGRESPASRSCFPTGRRPHPGMCRKSRRRGRRLRNPAVQHSRRSTRRSCAMSPTRYGTVAATSVR